jgi:hypothetical protein
MNMSDFDVQMRRLFGGVGAPGSERGMGLREELVGKYDERLKTVERRTWWGILGTSVAALFGCAFIVPGMTGDGKILICAWGMILLAIQFQVLLKLWYWVVNAKLTVLKEIYDLRLQLLEDRQRDVRKPGGETTGDLPQ